MGKAILGIIFIALGIFSGVFLSIYMLIISMMDIITNWDTITTFQLFLDILLIMFREIIGVVIAWGGIIVGISFLSKAK